jgi:hypothetical protein
VLRFLLDAHHRIACGPELKFIPILVGQLEATQRILGSHLREEFGIDAVELSSSYGIQLRALLEGYRKRRGKARVAEKTPQNVHCFAALRQMLPDAQLVHVIRDGRDVVLSLLKQDWIDLRTGQRVGYTQNARAAAQFWAQAIVDGRRAREGCYYELRYEDLVNDPERTLRGLMGYLEEPWDPNMLRFHEAKPDLPKWEQGSHETTFSSPLHSQSVGKWRTALSDADRVAIKEAAGPLLVELGYAENDDW